MRYALLALAAALPLASSADDFANYDLALRFPTAISHLSPFGEVAAKSGAAAASVWGSSPNPAGLSWGFQGNPCAYPNYKDPNHALSAQYSNLIFDQGQELQFFTQAFTLDLDDAGTFRFGFGMANSNERLIRGFPVAFGYESTGGRVDWGYQINEDFRIGVGAGYSEAQTVFKTSSFDAIRTDRETWGLRAGLNTSLNEKDTLMFGLYGDYGQGRNDSFTLLPSPSGALVAGRGKETVDQFILRTGFAKALDTYKTSWLNLDYEWSHYAIPSQTLNNHRVLLGADYLVKMVHIRAGTFIDGRGNPGWSAGLGIHLPKRTHIDLAYQANTFPEVRQEFGRSQTINVSLSLVW
jgi:hypothetical protein